ncbi:MAG: IS66 family insertion sequence element accessory protein TnpB [Chitinophagaceae bacterium]|nr:IS66 family insertion sequence element accessory protein TnpB [Oligoflexus sp.]
MSSRWARPAIFAMSSSAIGDKFFRPVCGGCLIAYRKSINSLSQIAVEELKLNPGDSALFVFVSRDRATLKVLYWDNSGFALWQKRLEKEKFSWLKSMLEGSLSGEIRRSVSLCADPADG